MSGSKQHVRSPGNPRPRWADITLTMPSTPTVSCQWTRWRSLENAAAYPHVTSALADLQGITLSYNNGRNSDSPRTGGVNSDVIALSQRFAMLMTEYQSAIEDGIITVNEAKRLLKETSMLQQVLIEMKLHLEEESVS